MTLVTGNCKKTNSTAMLGNAVYLEEESRRGESHTNRYLSKIQKKMEEIEKKMKILMYVYIRKKNSALGVMK